MKHLFPVLTLLLLPACVGMEQMQRQYLDAICNTEGSYQKGYNDGHGDGRMDSSYVTSCPSDQDAIRRAYREGFDKGVAVKASEPKPTEVHIVHEPAAPGADPDHGWTCVEAFGERKCGYDCKQAYGEAKCAKVQSHNCVAAFGVIKCGLRCAEKFGEIQCDRYE